MNQSNIEAYDQEAEASGWLGPEIAFGLAYKFIVPSQSILDIGIGTGLGSVLFHKAGLQVYGMDISEEMMNECRNKGITTELKQHDLNEVPYPYEQTSMDHAICVGVLQFFGDLNPVFREIGRILRNNGIFVFVVGDRNPEEESEVIVDSEHTHTGTSMIMYLHSKNQINTWLEENGLVEIQSLEFMVYMDIQKTKKLPARAYLARKITPV